LFLQTFCIFNIQYKIVSTFGKQTKLLFHISLPTMTV
jgi:hypothetical protein